MAGVWGQPAVNGSDVGSVPRRTAGHPSSLPDVIAVLALTVSAFLALVTAPETALTRMPVIGAAGSAVAGAAVGLVERSLTVSAAVGYLLTPFGVVGALAWARTAGVARLDDPWFDRVRLRNQMRRLQIMALLAFVLAVPHVVIIARAIQRTMGWGV